MIAPMLLESILVSTLQKQKSDCHPNQLDELENLSAIYNHYSENCSSDFAVKDKSLYSNVM